MAANHEMVRLVQRQDYQFTMQFGGVAPDWLADEPPPLGKGAGPLPVQSPDPVRCEVAAGVGVVLT